MSFLENLKWRYATKKFDKERIVSHDDLEKILEAIRFAPSSYGQQSFHVTIVSEDELKNELSSAAFGQRQVSTASQVLVFSARTDLLRRGKQYVELMKKSNPTYAERMRKMIAVNWLLKFLTFGVKSWATNQAAIALGFAMAAAAELRIDSCPMEGFLPQKVRHILDLPGYLKPVYLLPIGYRDSGEEVHQKVRFSKEDLFDFR